MPLDFSLPFELDDGTPVEVQGKDWRYVSATLPKSPYRPEWTGRRDRDWARSNRTWLFNAKDANADYLVFGGGTKEAMFTIRNVIDQAHTFVPEDWS